jgi:hypothetical protein
MGSSSGDPAQERSFASQGLRCSKLRSSNVQSAGVSFTDVRENVGGALLGVGVVLGGLGLAAQAPESTEVLRQGALVILVALAVAALILFMAHERPQSKLAPAAWPAAVIGVASAVALYLDLHERDRLEIEAKFVLAALIFVAAGLLIAPGAMSPRKGIIKAKPSARSTTSIGPIQKDLVLRSAHAQQ